MTRGFVRQLLARARRANDGPDSRMDDIDPATRDIYQAVQPYTMTSLPRVHALVTAVDYVIKRDVPGAFIECGVWRGGSVLAMLLRLRALAIQDRDVYLFDTFEGMTQPGPEDTSAYEPPALSTWRDAASAGRKAWQSLFEPTLFSLDQVRELMASSGYPAARIHIVQGKVEDTLPASLPAQVALARLDTDWYESTRHELVHVYPRLATAGVLIVDDYGHWRGCRRAVDEYFSSGAATPVLLNRVDYTARIAIKA